MIGLNVQYTSKDGLALYAIIPASSPSLGFNVGSSSQVNIAVGDGNWFGDFNNADVSAAGRAISAFQSPDNSWSGVANGT